MDFADDFTYFNFDQVLTEARELYRHNRHVTAICLRQAANDSEPALEFHINKPHRLGVHQLGLPVRFRNMTTRFIVANEA